MRASVFMAREGFARLARRIAEIEGRPRPEDGGSIPSANGPVRSPALRPTLPRRGISSRRAGAGRCCPSASPTSTGSCPAASGGTRSTRSGPGRRANRSAASGFATALLARLAGLDDRPILFVVEEEAAREGGHPYGPGLDQFGLDPARLVVVTTRRAAGDALGVRGGASLRRPRRGRSPSFAATRRPSTSPPAGGSRSAPATAA